MSKLPYFLFVVGFLIFANWLQLKIFIQHYETGNSEELHLPTTKIRQILETKANINADIKIYESPNIYGMMLGFPGHPVMIISSIAYNNLNNDELQWLVLHETGHYVLWHAEKEFILQVLLLIIAVIGMWKIKAGKNRGIILAICLAIVLGIIEIQLAKKFENEASFYALNKMDNPEGMTTGLKKLEAQARKSGLQESLFTQLTYRWEYSLYNYQMQMVQLYKK